MTSFRSRHVYKRERKSQEAENLLRTMQEMKRNEEEDWRKMRIERSR